MTNMASSKLAGELDIDGILSECVAFESDKIKRELDLYRRYYYSGQTITGFVSSVGREQINGNRVTKDTIKNIQRRYGLPSPPITVKHVSKLAKKQESENMLCSHSDCKSCAYLERAWCIKDRKVTD